MQKIITVNWEDEESIKQAGKQKEKLENSGYSLIETKKDYNFRDVYVLIYKKI